MRHFQTLSKSAESLNQLRRVLVAYTKRKRDRIKCFKALLGLKQENCGMRRLNHGEMHKMTIYLKSSLITARITYQGKNPLLLTELAEDF